MAQIPNHQYLLPQFVHKYPDGRVDGIGAVSWYITLVSNTDVFPSAPASWADMWAADKKKQIGTFGLAIKLVFAGNNRQNLFRRV